MEQSAERTPSTDKSGWLLAGTPARAVPRPGLRVAERSGLAFFRSAVALPRKVEDHVRPALYRAGKMDTHTAARLSWTVWALSLALTAFSILLLSLNQSHNAYVFDYWIENTLIAVASSTVGAVIASRRPENLIGWLFCMIGFLNGARHFCAEYATYASLEAPGSPLGGEALTWISSWTWVPNLGLYVFLGLLFPDGRLPTSRWRWVAWLGATVVLMGTALVAFSPGPVYGLGSIQNPLGIEGMNNAVGLVEVLLLTLELVAAVSLFMRLRHARGVERQQLKWVTYAAAVAVGGLFLERIVSEAVGVLWVSWAGFVLVVVGIVGIPVTMCIAILKYRLYDIDILINRTLVYGALSASVVGIYVLVVGGLGALLQVSDNFAISLLATGVVAVVFQPLRNRLQCGVDRLMYGERDQPYRVLSRLGQRLEGTLAPDAALKTIVETVAQALKLPYAAIFLKQDDSLVTAAEYGTPMYEPATLPLIHQKEQVGLLVVAPRAPGEAFTPSDRSLLEDLARQAGVAAHAVRLTTDLQRSRERLVTAREEERRRLRRDLHDGLGPTLAGLTFGLDAARNLLTHQEPKDADTLLAELKGQTQEAVLDVRRLVYGLRPPALDDLGLVTAIREQAASHGYLVDDLPDGMKREAGRRGRLAFTVEAPELLPPLPAAVEVACYRIAQEAMTNVARHARACVCRVRLSLDAAYEALELEVTDDGVGLSEDRRVGVGLTSMRERAAELGGACAVASTHTGGTRVLARLPLSAQEE